jgi:hypothetical protein
MAAALDTSSSSKFNMRVCTEKKSNYYASSWLRTLCSTL